MCQIEKFTWDWIVNANQRDIQHLTTFIDQDPTRVHQAQEIYRRGYEALNLAVAELREHPQLADNVPMRSLGTLRWFPNKQYEVDVYYDVYKLRYEVSILKHDPVNRYGLDSLIERKYAYLSKLPAIVVELIEKTKQLPSD